MSDQEDFARREMMRLHGGVAYVDLYGDAIAEVEIGLEHVRASDGIRVRYDFERDGFVILQTKWTDDDVTGELWQEVAFVKSWALDVRTEEG